MNRPSKVTKRCQRCEELFDIPNMTQSHARDVVLEFYPCPYCGYAPAVLFPRYQNRSGRCRKCSVPFSIIDHHGKGFCKRCHMAELRHKQQ